MSVAWSRVYTDQIPTRWPYAPAGAKVRVVPAARFVSGWGGRWDAASKTAYVNADLPPQVQVGIIAHELAHGRWSTTRPEMPGEEGSAALVYELLDELRVERFAIRHTTSVRDDFRGWINTVAGQTIPIRNRRGAALVYGSLIGHHHTGALTEQEVTSVRDQFRALYGDEWILTFDGLLLEAMAVPPGQTGNLMGVARRWDRAAIYSAILDRNPD